MKIPSYPAFKEFNSDVKELLSKALKKDIPEISEYTFTNLYIWREAYKLQVSIIDGFIILKSSKDRLPSFFPPIGTGNKKIAITRILHEAGGAFIRIPESIKSLFTDDERFIIQYDLDNSDYVFNMGDLVNLPGRKYDGKRNLIKKFKSTYEFKYADLNSSNIEKCLEFEEKWCVIKDCNNVEGLRDERRTISEVVNNFSDFNIIGGAIFINNAISAIAIGERLNPDTIVLHFLKADPNIKGLYQLMMNEFLSRLEGWFKFVNMEQDLGIEGLRNAKLSYHPVLMIKKYILRIAK